MLCNRLWMVVDGTDYIKRSQSMMDDADAEERNIFYESNSRMTFFVIDFPYR